MVVTTAVIINIDEKMNTMSLSTDHALFDHFHIYHRSDIRFRLGECKFCDLQEMITYEDEKHRKRVLINRLNDMIEDQATFRNPYIIQGLVAEKFGVKQFDSFIPPMYTYKQKIDREKNNYQQIKIAQNKEFAKKKYVCVGCWRLVAVLLLLLYFLIGCCLVAVVYDNIWKLVSMKDWTDTLWFVFALWFMFLYCPLHILYILMFVIL